MKRFLLVFLCFTTVLFGSNIVIATGGKSGNYYKVGKDINKKVFKNRAKVINTQGSVENMLLVASGKADIALVQADALVLLDLFFSKKDKKFYELVEIAGKIYTETLHVIVNKKSKIKTLDDLNGKVVSFGGSKSGNSVTATTLEENGNLKFDSVLDISVSKAIRMVDQNKLDALFYVTKSPSKFINKFKNIKLVHIDIKLPKSVPLSKEYIPSKQYDFLSDSVSTLGVDTLVILKNATGHLDSIKSYLKTIDGADANIDITRLKKEKSSAKKRKNLIKIDQRVIKKYSSRYGNGALVRLNYIIKKVSDLEDKKLVKKLKEVNKLVNRLKFLTDKRLWKKDDHWATSLESLGTGYSDTEERAMIKFLLLTKLGIDPAKLKIIKKDSPLKIKNKKHSENIALAYFHKKNEAPIILDYSENEENLYKLKEEFKYTIVKDSQSVGWKNLFIRNFNEKKVDQIFGKLN